MKTIETVVYEFDELSDKAKEQARQWFREGEDFNGESVIEDAITVAELLGIDIATKERKSHSGRTFQEPCVYFTGFSSQGDGACFDGAWRADSVRASEVEKYAPKDATLHRIANEFGELVKLTPSARFTVKHSGRYSHKYCTDFDYDPDPDATDEELQKLGDIAVLEKRTIEAARDFMQWIYDQLNRDYDYQMSNESVDENIRANGYTFTESGKRFG